MSITSTPATTRAVVPNQTDESPRKFRISAAQPVVYAFTNSTHSLTPGTQHDFGVSGFQSVAEFKPQQWNYSERTNGKEGNWCDGRGQHFRNIIILVCCFLFSFLYKRRFINIFWQKNQNKSIACLYSVQCFQLKSKDQKKKKNQMHQKRILFGLTNCWTTSQNLRFDLWSRHN